MILKIALAIYIIGSMYAQYQSTKLAIELKRRVKALEQLIVVQEDFIEDFIIKLKK